MSRLKITNARRKQRVRNSLRRTASGRPRLSVFRSSKHIYAQVIDDLKCETLASASSLEKTMREAGNTGAGKKETAVDRIHGLSFRLQFLGVAALVQLMT